MPLECIPTAFGGPQLLDYGALVSTIDETLRSPNARSYWASFTTKKNRDSQLLVVPASDSPPLRSAFRRVSIVVGASPSVNEKCYSCGAVATALTCTECARSYCEACTKSVGGTKVCANCVSVKMEEVLVNL